MGRIALLTQMPVRLGAPRKRCRGKTDLFGEMSESSSITKFEFDLLKPNRVPVTNAANISQRVGNSKAVMNQEAYQGRAG